MAGFIGKLVNVTLGGIPVQCETNASFTIETGTSQLSRCKGQSLYSEFMRTNITWSVEVDANALLSSIAVNQFSMIEYMQEGSDVSLVFSTILDPDFDERFAVAGMAIITNFTWEAPSSDGSTWSATFQGNGPLSFTHEENIIMAWSQNGSNGIIANDQEQLIFVK